MFRSCFIGGILSLVVFCACSADAPPTPSDDPNDYDVNTSVEYTLKIGEPRWVVPSAILPEEITPSASNNNVDIVFHDGRLYMAWRSAPTHFASSQTVMWIMSSSDMGETWDFETKIHIGSDMREPRFLSLNNTLQLFFFEGGTDPLAFEPKAFWRCAQKKTGQWHEPEIFIREGEIPWDIKVRYGKAYMTSYAGTLYSSEQEPYVEIFFKESADGQSFKKVEEADFVHAGGSSEAAFEFDSDGSLWAVLRNQEGDASGKGSRLCYAPADKLSQWDCGDTADPNRYDSPELFRHGDDIYLVARRDIDGIYGNDESQLPYSLRPKTSAIYQINKTERSIAHLRDLPGVGDTAFPAVRRTGAHTFLLANYTSPLDDPDISWIAAQTSDAGTLLYLLDIEFVPGG
jgi:hypothetical protein